MEEERNIIYCWHCQEEIDLDNDEHYEIYNGETICEDCRDNYYCACQDCDDLVLNDDMTYIEDRGYYVCDNCRENYNYCEDCGNYYSDDTEFHEDANGNWYCDNCWEEDEEEYIIRSYHNRDLPIEYLYTEKDLEDKTIYATKDTEHISENMLKMGMEIEVENTDNNIDSNEMAHMIRNKFPHLKLVFEGDGSLRDGGFEIITQPMTMAYIREHKEDFKELCKMLSENGFTSHNNGRCGQHIHFSRNFFSDDDDKYVGKLQLFFERYKNEIYRFSRRNNTSWCAWVSDNAPYNKEYFKSSKILCDYAKRNTGHGVAINLEHSSTIEIRVMRGTLKYETMMSNFEFVNSLVHIVKEKPTRQINFDKVVNFEGNEFLPNYCTQNGIYNSEFMSDETSNIFKTLQTKKDNYEEVKKDVKKEIQEVLGEMMTLTKNLMSDIPNLENDTEETIKTLFNTTSSLQSLITNNIDFIKSSALRENNDRVEDNYMNYITNNRSYNYNEVLRYYENIRDYLPTNDYTQELKDKMNKVIKTLQEKYINNGMGVEI